MTWSWIPRKLIPLIEPHLPSIKSSCNIVSSILFLASAGLYRTLLNSPDHLFTLLRRIHWGINGENAFQTLKPRLISTPILKQAYETKPFTLPTDASIYSLEAVLLQNKGSEQHPIECTSRLLISAEPNYSTVECEVLAVFWALNKFRGYINGTDVTVISDHQPLRWLMSLKSPSGRLTRLALQFQEFSLKIDHIIDKANVTVIMLSRPTCDYAVQESCDDCSVIIDIPKA